MSDQADQKQKIQDCIDYSIYQFMESGKCGNGTGSSRLKNAKELLSFHGGRDYAEYSRTYSRVCNTISKGDIYTSLKTSYLFDTREAKMRIDLLLLVAAVKSIIGHKRNFTRTNRQFILSRMYGREHPMTRYQFDKLVNEAMSKRMFALIPAGRGYYVSIRHTPTELGAIVMQRISQRGAKQIEAAKAGKDIAMLKREIKNTLRKIPKTAP